MSKTTARKAEASKTSVGQPGEGSHRSGLAFISSFAVAVALTRLTRRRTTVGSLDHTPVGRAPSRRSAVDACGSGRGRAAETPTEIPSRGWWDILWRVWGGVGDDRLLAVAAGVTFYGLLALFPAIGALVSLYGLVADPSTIGDHLSILSGFLPGGALDVIGEQVRRIISKAGGRLGLAFFSGLAVSLWSANAGMKAIFDALNVAYEEKEKRNFIVLNLWSLAFTLAGLAFLIVAMSSVVVVPVVLNFVGLGGAVAWLIWIGRWPLMIFVTLGALAILYRYGPSRDRAQWRWITPGSLLAAIGWLAFSMLFSWYVGSFGAYNETYGSLGAAIGFMTWLWLSATIILVGAELNAEIEHQTAKDTTEGPPEPLGERDAHMADTIGRSRS